MTKAKPYAIPKQIVWDAYKKVKVNRGAAGVDGQSLAPSLHVHYRRFITNTDQSAPVPRIGTQILVGLPLGSLP